MIVFDFFKCNQDELLESFCSYFDMDIAQTKVYFDKCDWGKTNAVDLIKGLSIDLSRHTEKDAFCIGCHLTTTSQDGIVHFQQNGIYNLAQMLCGNNDLSHLLHKRGISIDYYGESIEIDGKTYTLDFDSGKCRFCLKGDSKPCGSFCACELKEKLNALRLKLYEFSATTEFFISGSLDEMKQYSTVARYPEILYTLEELCYVLNIGRRVSLPTEWKKNHQTCIAIKFYVNIADMETFNPCSLEAWFRDYGECITDSGFNSDDYYMGQIPKKVFDNFFIVNKMVSFYGFGSSEQYGSLLPNLHIQPSQIIEINQIN